MNEICDFLNKLKQLSQFKLMPNSNELKGEFKEILAYSKKKDFQKLISIWNEKCKKVYFELDHPLIDGVKVYAVKNYFHETNNLVFCIDKDNRYPVVINQYCCFINSIILPSRCYYIVADPWNDGEITRFQKQYDLFLNSVDLNTLIFRKREFAFTLENVRPAHLFYQLLSNFIMIKHNDKCVFAKNSFYIPPNVRTTTSGDLVYLSPYCYEYNYNFEGLRKLLIPSLKMDGVKSDYDIVLWVNIPGERRKWIQQEDFIINFIQQIKKYFSRIKIYIDGITVAMGEKKDIPERKKILDEIELKINQVKNCVSIDIVSLAGLDYKIKIQSMSEVNFVISEPGTGSFISELYDKPILSFPIFPVQNHSGNITYTQGKYLNIFDRKHTWVFSYHIPWQHVYNLAAEALEELSRENKLKVKNLKMHRLEVPPVELIAKQYEFEKQFEVKIPLENVEFVDKLVTQLQQKDQIIQTKNQELTSKTQELTQTKNQLDTIKVQLDSTQKELDSKTKELSSLPIKKQTLEIKNLEQDLINKQLHTKQLEKELGYESNVLQELEIKNQQLTQIKNQLDSTKKQLETKNKILSSNPNPSHLIQNTSNFKGKLSYLNTLTTAKDRIHNHLSYKLGQAMIENSKSLLGYIRMPYVLSYIKDKHKQEQQQYQEAIKKNPNLKLPNLESYPDYQESLKEKECLAYKLGEAFIKADKTWYKGGYVKLWFEVRKLKGERK